MRKLGWIGLLSAGWAVAACSLLVERGDEFQQCSTTADCTGRGAAFSGYTCSTDRVCVAPPSLGDGGSNEGGFTGDCKTNQECIDANSGAPAICKKSTRKCAPLLTSDCDTVRSVSPTGDALEGAAAVRDDATIVIGSLLSLTGNNGPKNLTRVDAITYAIQEIMTSAAGLPPATGTSARRPLAVLSCNDVEAANPPPPKTAPVRASEHLIEVGVPAVIGCGTTGLTQTAIPILTAKEAGVLLMAPSATSPLLTDVDDNGLFWRTAPSDALQAIPLANRVQAAAPEASGKKVAFIYKGDAYGQGLNERVQGLVKGNGGKPLNDPSSGNGALVLSKQYGATQTDFSTLLNEIWAFKPDVVVIMGTNEGVTNLLVPLEKDWATKTGVARPNYVVSDGLKSSALTNAVADDEKPAGLKSGLRVRVVGTAPGRPSLTTNAFYTRFEGKYGNSNSRTFGTAGAYDAAFTIFYALAATPDQAPSGQSVAKGITKLVGGSSKVDVGGNGVNEAFQKLTVGTAIDLNGASSPLTFNDKGESPADIEVWCLPPATEAIPAPTFKTTDLYFDATLNTVTGSFNCDSF